LNENFVKVIEEEYAVRFLEKMGIEANPRNIARLKKTQPLSSCEFAPGWNSSGWLADVLYIYPNKVKKQSFDSNREAIMQAREEQARKKREAQAASDNLHSADQFLQALDPSL
jgi:hypothetical protein